MQRKNIIRKLIKNETFIKLDNYQLIKLMSGHSVGATDTI